MNERIKELYEQAHERKPVMVVDPQTGNPIQAGWANKPMYGNKFNPEKFAELIVKECIYTLQLKIVRNGNTPENLRSREHIRDLGEKFGIEFPMDYYPDRNKHFGVES